MGFIIGLLTFVMVLDCVVLVLLVFIQLPKKEAGAGLAFCGAASDALLGAGSGNVLTKVSMYAATIFFVMTLLLSILLLSRPFRICASPRPSSRASRDWTASRVARLQAWPKDGT